MGLRLNPPEPWPATPAECALARAAAASLAEISTRRIKAVLGKPLFSRQAGTVFCTRSKATKHSSLHLSHLYCTFTYTKWKGHTPAPFALTLKEMGFDVLAQPSEKLARMIGTPAFCRVDRGDEEVILARPALLQTLRAIRYERIVTIFFNNSQAFGHVEVTSELPADIKAIEAACLESFE